MLECSKCKNEIKMGEIQCSKCGEYIRLGTGRRALYNIMSIVVGIIAPLFTLVIAFALSGGFYNEVEGTPVMLWMLITIPVCFVLNLITSTAMRRENWNKAQDVIMILPVIIYAAEIVGSVIMLTLGESSGKMFIINFAMLLILQIWLLSIALKVRKRLKAIKATYDEYYRLKNTK